MVTWSTYVSFLDGKYNNKHACFCFCFVFKRVPRSGHSKHDILHFHISISIQDIQLQ